MTIKIRGFILPPLLVKFLNDGVWTHKRSITVPPAMLSELGIDFEVVVRLYDLEGLKLDNTYFDKMTDESFNFLKLFCAWESSKKTGVPITDSSKLDIDYAVCIASELDDNVIYLDYRIDKNNPRVLVMDWNNREWRILSPDFDTFAKAVGLID